MSQAIARLHNKIYIEISKTIFYIEQKIKRKEIRIKILYEERKEYEY